MKKNAKLPPLGVKLSADVEPLPGLPLPFRARVRWTDPTTKKRSSLSQSTETEEQARDWIESMHALTRGGLDPNLAIMTLAEYGEKVMALALRGLEGKTLDPYRAGWR